MLNRRRFLVAAIAVPAVAAVGSSAAAAPASTHSLWVLDPEWGYPLTTDTGSDTKTRCRGNACRAAAPHRFFLSQADALAGRLHPCCLAQPVQVDVCVDLNELMPFYSARLGGIDARCPELPAEIRSALAAPNSCADPDPDPSPDPDPDPDTDTDSSGSVVAPSTGTSTSGLPAAGSNATRVLGIAAVATVAGTAMVRASSCGADPSGA